MVSAWYLGPAVHGVTGQRSVEGRALLRLLGVPDKLTPHPKDLVTGSPQLSRGRRSRLSDRVRHFPKATQPVIASLRFKLRLALGPQTFALLPGNLVPQSA